MNDDARPNESAAGPLASADVESSKKDPCHVETADLCKEIKVMIRFALGRGKAVPESVLNAIAGGSTPSTVSEIVKAHAEMGRIVAPATPRSIVATEVEGGREASIFDIPVLRQMMIVGGISALGFALLSVLFVPEDPGYPLAEQATFFFAAALGASFFGLNRAHGYVVARTFEPSYTAEYWVRFALGVIAGLVLANVLQATLDQGAQPGQVVTPIPSNMIALLGGYSADAVNRILTRLVETLEALVAGRSTELLNAQRRAIEQRAKIDAARISMGTAAEIMALQQDLASGASTDELQTRLKEIADALLDASNP